ncbi:mandelate racemase/muconate lactonizing enzyme family protein [Muricoccus radiodurans]|uniref:mandelate racemase/muconate lactonizing enzyme family protein n=1 Tax=Muricoccus radiodurans TaxID=2231721 RepID=UPI003CEB033E
MDDLRIVSLRHWLVRVPFRTLIEWGSGTRSGATRLIVRVETAGGTVGWGETICLLDAIPAVLDRAVAPIALRHRVDEAEAFSRHVLGAGYYHHKRAAVMAMAAVEMAMWDALGRACGRPLHALWGGRFREHVPMVGYILAAAPEDAAAAARGLLAAGHRSFKVKIGMSEATDVPLVAAVRAVIGDLPLRADVNGAWTPGTARRLLAKLAPYDLSWIEQPLELDDLIGHAELRRSQPVPIALDESAYTLQDVGNIVRMGAADVVLLDPHEAGGCWAVIKQAAICESAGIPVTLHSGGELGLSQAAYLHLAASIPNLIHSVDTERAYLSADVVREEFLLEEGSFPVPAGPGLGVTVDEAALDRFTVERIEGAYLDPKRPDWFPLKPAY